MMLRRQTSFACGAFSPLLWGRTDLSIYAHGARKLRNFLVAAQGAAVTRPGTQRMFQFTWAPGLLVSYVLSDTVSYVLAFSEGRVRIYAPTSTGTAVVDLATPYTLAELPALRWAQFGGDMLFTHPNHVTKRLTPPVNSLGAFTFSDFVRHPATPLFVAVPGGVVWSPHLRFVDFAAYTAAQVGDNEHPPREWRWKATVIFRNNITGEEVESFAVDVTRYYLTTDYPPTPANYTNQELPNDGLFALYPDRPITLACPDFGGTALDDGSFYLPPGDTLGWTPVGVCFYRGRGVLFGFVGSTRHAQAFRDVGDEPDYQRQPPMPTEPMKPATVSFFQNRAVLGLGRRVNFSAVDDWTRHNISEPPAVVDDMAMEFDISTQLRESARSSASLRRLLVLTGSSVHSIGGTQGPLTPTSVETRLEDNEGIHAALPPLLLPGMVLYQRANGFGVKALIADGENYNSVDVSAHAEHFFRANHIVSWCYQQHPFGVVWAVRDDGALLSLTPSPTGWAWCIHDFDGALVRNVACVTVDGRDTVFVHLQRGSQHFMERMAAREAGGAVFAVDSAVSTTAAAGTTPTITGLNHLEGSVVWACIPGSPPQRLTVTAGAVTLATPIEGAGTKEVRVGRAFVAELETLDAAPGDSRQKAVVRVGLEVDNSIGLEVGQDFDHLVEWVQRTPVDSYSFVSAASQLVEVMVKGGYQRHGRAAIRQSKPQPLTLLGITREIDVGGS